MISFYDVAIETNMTLGHTPKVFPSTRPEEMSCLMLCVINVDMSECSHENGGKSLISVVLLMVPPGMNISQTADVGIPHTAFLCLSILMFKLLT